MLARPPGPPHCGHGSWWNTSRPGGMLTVAGQHAAQQHVRGLIAVAVGGEGERGRPRPLGLVEFGQVIRAWPDCADVEPPQVRL